MGVEENKCRWRGLDERKGRKRRVGESDGGLSTRRDIKGWVRRGDDGRLGVGRGARAGQGWLTQSGGRVDPRQEATHASPGVRHVTACLYHVIWASDVVSRLGHGTGHDDL